MLGLTNFVWPKIPEDKNSASIYGQDVELLKPESHMHLHDIKSSPYFAGHNNFRSMSSMRLNLSTKQLGS